MNTHNLSRFWHLCQSCARGVYAAHQPSHEYADRVARLLFGTGAQEGGYRHSRQMGYGLNDSGGAFSYWQVEAGSVSDSVALLRRNRACQDSVRDWLPDTLRTFLKVTTTGSDYSELMRALVFSPELGVLFARLHYLRIPELVPVALEDQAAYWKQHYNTTFGKGTAQEYLGNWVRLCAEVVK